MGEITDYTLMPAVEVIDVNDDKTHAPELGANNFGIKLEELKLNCFNLSKCFKVLTI